MGGEDFGECSRRHENNDDERPLKKARYVWEVKGKYHLKASYKNSINETKSTVDDESKEEIGNESIFVEHNLNNNLILNNNNDCTDRCCIETFLAKTDALMESDEEESSPNIEKSIHNEIPITLVSSNPKNQDYYLRKWQARQIARGFVDNTINRVLENWMVAPFDAADFVENCDNDGHVEDEGILMAIQSHGLQSNSEGNMVVQNADEDEFDDDKVERIRKDTPVSFVRPQEIAESTLDNFENVHNELIKEGMSSSNDSMSCDSPDNSILNDDCNHTDFLNAAVSAAILKKGLSSYSY